MISPAATQQVWSFQDSYQAGEYQQNNDDMNQGCQVSSSQLLIKSQKAGSQRPKGTHQSVYSLLNTDVLDQEKGTNPLVQHPTSGITRNEGTTLGPFKKSELRSGNNKSSMVHRISIQSNHSRSSPDLDATPATLNQSEKDLSKILSSCKNSTEQRRNQGTDRANDQEFRFEDQEEEESPGIPKITSKFAILAPVRKAQRTIDVPTGTNVSLEESVSKPTDREV